MDFIPVCEPFLSGNELKYVADAIETGWISSAGKYVKAFEDAFASYCGAKYAVGVCNGTMALHLALVSLGIKEGDEVIIPNFTMIASAFAVCYTKAVPVFVDVDIDTWNIDPKLIESKITDKTRAIMSVSIFGNPCPIDAIKGIADKYNLKIIEDAAESVGAEYKGIKTGNLADISAFSFFANKNITTGEGGMVVTNDEDLYQKCLYYKNLCFALDAPRNYLHNDIGFNYRLSNLHAAIGLAQTEKADLYRKMRILNANLYKKYLDEVAGIYFQKTQEDSLSVHWMNALVIKPEEFGQTRDQLLLYLRQNGIDSRLFFIGMNKQPSLIRYGCKSNDSYPVTDNLSANGFYLPSASNLSEAQIAYICDTIKQAR